MASKRRILFVDRDGTLINEPADFQIDSLEKLELVPGVIPALLSLQQAGYELKQINKNEANPQPVFLQPFASHLPPTSHFPFSFY